MWNLGMRASENESVVDETSEAPLVSLTLD